MVWEFGVRLGNFAVFGPIVGGFTLGLNSQNQAILSVERKIWFRGVYIRL